MHIVVAVGNCLSSEPFPAVPPDTHLAGHDIGNVMMRQINLVFRTVQNEQTLSPYCTAATESQDFGVSFAQPTRTAIRESLAMWREHHLKPFNIPPGSYLSLN